MKSFLIFLITNIYIVSFAQNKVFDKRDSLKKIIAQEFTSKGFESARAIELFDSLNKKYRVKKILFVNSRNTSYSHYLWPMRLMLINATKSPRGNFVSTYNEWIGELTHAKQFTERPLYQATRAVKGLFQTFGKVIFHAKDYREQAMELARENRYGKFKSYLWVAYQDQYTDEKSFEYEAHKVIEPFLNNYFLKKLEQKSLTSL